MHARPATKNSFCKNALVRLLVTISLVTSLSTSSFGFRARFLDQFLLSFAALTETGAASPDDGRAFGGGLPLTVPTPTPVAQVMNVELFQFTRGAKRDLSVGFLDAACPGTIKFDDKDKVISAQQIADLKRSGIIIDVADDADPCELKLSVEIAASAQFTRRSVKLQLKRGDTTVPAEIVFELIDEPPTPPGPIPPGMKPEVDIFWSVVPQSIVKDNFGRRIGQQFYCIEVVIGNNSGYDLQIASVGFNLGPVGPAATAMNKTYDTVIDEIKKSQKTQIGSIASIDKDCKANGVPLEGLPLIECRNKALAKQLSDLNASQRALVGAVKEQADLLTQFSRVPYNQKVPVSSYRMARGSIEHGQFLSLRNLGLNSIRALGPFLTGFLPFFHNLNHRTNFSQGINIFNNPVEKGFDLLIPDETITQMQRLDDGILRDGMIIQNNRQFRTRVLFPKDLLKLEGGLRDNPIIVTQALGQMYLIGDTVKFINRVSVTSAGSGEILPPPRVSPKDIELVIGDTQTFDVSGTFLEGASVASDDPTNIKVMSVSSTRTSATIQVNILPKAAIGPHTFLLSTAGGTANVHVNFTQPAPELDNPTPVFDKTPTIKTPGTEFSFTLTGKYFQDASLTVADSSTSAIELVPNSTEISDGGTKLRAKIRVLDTAKSKNEQGAPIEYIVKIKNPQSGGEAEIKIRLQDRAAPTVKNESELLGGKNPPAYKKSGPLPLTITGTNLYDASLDADANAKAKGISVKVLDNKNPDALQAQVSLKETTPPGIYSLELKNEGGKHPIAFTVDPQEAVIVTGAEPTEIKSSDTEQKLNIKIKGSNLRQTTVTLSGGLVWQVENPPSKRESESGEELILDVKLPANTPAGTASITVKNEGTPAGKEGKVDIEIVAPPAAPAPSITKFQVGSADVESASVNANLVIVGQNLKGATAVKFGDTPAELVPANVQDGQITVVIPNVAPGVIEVLVTTTAGTTARKSITITPP